MSFFNYRVFAEDNKDYPEGFNIQLAIYECYYEESERNKSKKDMIPNAYISNPSDVNGETIEEIQERLAKMQEAVNFPIISIKNFPEHFKH